MLLSVSVCLITKDQTEVISVFPVNVQVLEIKGHKKVAQNPQSDLILSQVPMMGLVEAGVLFIICGQCHLVRVLHILFSKVLSL